MTPAFKTTLKPIGLNKTYHCWQTFNPLKLVLNYFSQLVCVLVHTFMCMCDVGPACDQNCFSHNY